MHVHLGAHGTHSLDIIHHLFKGFLLSGPVVSGVKGWPCLRHDGLGRTGQSLIQFLGDEGHEGMQQLERLIQHIHQHTAGGVGLLCIAGVQAGLCDLDEPVAVDIPDKAVDLGSSQTHLIVLQIIGHGTGHLIQLGQHPLVAHVQQLFTGQTRLKVLGQVHQHKAGGVPQLIGKVAGSLHLLFDIAHIVARGGAVHQHKAQGIRAVLGNDLQRIDAVAKALGHLAALTVADDAVDADGIKRSLAGVSQTGEDHAADPEADDVVAGDQRIGGVEILEVGAVLVGPAQRAEGPQRRGEPGIQRIGVPRQLCAAALGAGAGSGLCHHGLAAVVAVPSRDLVAPPQLTADAPVAGVLHPVHIVLGKALGHKLDLALLYALNGGLCQRLHLDEPLLGDHGLDGGVAAVAGAHLVLQGLDLLQEAALFQVGQNSLACLQRSHAGVLAAVQHMGLVDGVLTGGKQSIGGSLVGSAGHVAVVSEHAHDGQVVAQTDLKVVGVVGGGDLHDTGALGHIGVLIADDGDFLVQQGQHHMAAVQMGVAGILTVDGHGGIAQHGLGAGGGQLQHLAGLLDRVQQMPEAAVLLLVLHLGIRDGGVAVGAPVDHAVAAVDQAFVVQAHEHFLDSLRAAFVHGKALALPVAAAAQLLQLADDAVAVLGLPCPGALQKTIAADHLLGQALGAHSFHHLGFGSNGGVVGAGHPQGGIALHPLGADEDILHGVIHRMAHVQLTGNVRWRHHDGIRFLVRIGLRVEVAAVQPELVDTIFHLTGIVLLCKLFHSVLPKI